MQGTAGENGKETKLQFQNNPTKAFPNTFFFLFFCFLKRRFPSHNHRSNLKHKFRIVSPHLQT